MAREIQATSAEEVDLGMADRDVSDPNLLETVDGVAVNPADLPPQSLVGKIITVAGMGTGRVLAFNKVPRFNFLNKHSQHLVDFSVAPASWDVETRNPNELVELRRRKGAAYSHGKAFSIVNPSELDAPLSGEAEKDEESAGGGDDLRQRKIVEKMEYCNEASVAVRQAFTKACKADGTWDQTADDWAERLRLLRIFIESEAGKGVVAEEVAGGTATDSFVVSDEVLQDVQAEVRRRSTSSAIMKRASSADEEGGSVAAATSIIKRRSSMIPRDDNGRPKSGSMLGYEDCIAKLYTDNDGNLEKVFAALGEPPDAALQNPPNDAQDFAVNYIAGRYQVAGGTVKDFCKGMKVTYANKGRWKGGEWVSTEYFIIKDHGDSYYDIHMKLEKYERYYKYNRIHVSELDPLETCAEVVARQAKEAVNEPQGSAEQVLTTDVNPVIESEEGQARKALFKISTQIRGEAAAATKGGISWADATWVQRLAIVEAYMEDKGLMTERPRSSMIPRDDNGRPKSGSMLGYEETIAKLYTDNDGNLEKVFAALGEPPDAALQNPPNDAQDFAINYIAGRYQVAGNKINGVTVALSLAEQSLPGYPIGSLVYSRSFTFEFQGLDANFKFEPGTVGLVCPFLPEEREYMQANPGSLKVLFAPPNKGLMFINSKWVSKEPVRYSFEHGSVCGKFTNLKAQPEIGVKRGLIFQPAFWLSFIFPAVVINYAINDSWGKDDDLDCADNFPTWAISQAIIGMAWQPGSTLFWQLFSYAAAYRQRASQTSQMMFAAANDLEKYDHKHTKEDAENLWNWAKKCAFINRQILRLRYAALALFATYWIYGYVLLFSSEVDCGKTLYTLMVIPFWSSVGILSITSILACSLLPLMGHPSQDFPAGLPLFMYCLMFCCCREELEEPVPETGTQADYWAAGGDAYTRRAYQQSVKPKKWEKMTWGQKTEGIMKFKETHERPAGN